MIWTLLVIALTANGQSVATHTFQSREICLAIKQDIEHQLPRAQAMCLEESK